MLNKNTKNKVVTIVGAGVIGAGWAARFLLNGWNVNVFDLNKNIEGYVNQVITNAKNSLSLLTNNNLLKEGNLIFTDNLEEAIKKSCWVQESLPERLQLKQEVLCKISHLVLKEAVIASSTSGFKPSELNDKSKIAEQVLVVHPYNPVYLLPGVEIVGLGAKKNKYKIKAIETLREIGMKPVLLNKEIEAHIGDRLLEAIWREALWLVKDNIASTKEIDDLIIHTFGLRWAQMGLFETYRLGGGEGGMRHFLNQFAPSLLLPWSKLTNVPTLDNCLVDKIIFQSEHQSKNNTIRELEKKRDENLVGILNLLKSKKWGAGITVSNWLEKLEINQHRNSLKLFTGYKTKVKKKWIDYNGHMTEFRYLQVISEACDYFLNYIGLNREYLLSGYSFYTVENHIRHLKEVKYGECLSVRTQILFYDNKKIHLWHSILNLLNEEIATGEQLLLHVDQKKGKVINMSKKITKNIKKIYLEHSLLKKPEGAGRSVGQKLNS